MQCCIQIMSNRIKALLPNNTLIASEIVHMMNTQKGNYNVRIMLHQRDMASVADFQVV